MTAHSARPNVVWVSLESVRADHTTVGGYHLDTTPNLQRIVDAGGVNFPLAFAHARWTPAVTTSIMTATPESVHRVGYDDTRDVRQVPAEMKPLAERLSEMDYRTALFSSNPYVSPATGLDRGFDRVHLPPTARDLRSTAGVRTALRYAREFNSVGAGPRLGARWHKSYVLPRYQTETLKQWIREFGRDRQLDGRPFFLYTHMNSSHHPYNPPLRLLERFLRAQELDDVTPEAAIERAKSFTNNIWEWMAEGSALSERDRKILHAVYDAEIALVDAYVGELFDLVGRVAGPTVFVVTGDHGDLFGEGGVLGHNLTLHDGLVHVPLVVHGLEGVEVAADDIVQHADVTTTVVAALGGDVDGFMGVDLRRGGRECALFQRGPRSRDLAAIREFNPAFDASEYHEGAIDAVRTREWKYVRGDFAQLFRLPDEETNVIDANPEVAAELDELLTELVPDHSYDDVDAGQADFSEEMRDHLTHLGYL
jgi:arylsulfatase A-like enzyme